LPTRAQSAPQALRFRTRAVESLGTEEGAACVTIERYWRVIVQSKPMEKSAAVKST
jgi:hypothetical protein